MYVLLFSFLADRTDGRTIDTVLRLSVVCNVAKRCVLISSRPTAYRQRGRPNKMQRQESPVFDDKPERCFRDHRT